MHSQIKPSWHAIAGGLIAAFLIALYTMVGNPVNLLLAVLMAAVGFGLAAHEADQRDAILRIEWETYQRGEDIRWWIATARNGTPLEREIAPQVISILQNS